MKKRMLAFVCFCALIGVVGCEKQANKTEEEAKPSEQETADAKAQEQSEKSLVLYFSATGNTEAVAQTLAEATDSELVEIIPEVAYSEADLDYGNDQCRANQEQNDDAARPGIQNVISIDHYQRIYLGYPIWWGTNPKIILTLFDEVDFDGKEVALFCTSGGSGIETSVRELEAYREWVNWLGGQRFSAGADASQVRAWVDSLQ